MPAILGHDEVLAGVKDAVSSSIVTVKSFRFRGVAAAQNKKRRFDNAADFNRTNYKCCTGFIIKANRSAIFIAVHKSHIDLDDGDLIRVFFHDGAVEPAKPFMGETESELMILMVELRNPRYPTVRNAKVDRGNVIVLSADGNNLRSDSASIINPTTEAVSASDCKVILAGTGKWFTLGCDADTEDILGSPIFMLDGSFVGIISGDDVSVKHSNAKLSETAVGDLKYGLHGEYFLANLRIAIQDKLDAYARKKTKGMANRRR